MAAGFDKDGDAYNALANFGFGFVEIGSLTPKPQEGNPKPRCFRLTKDKALINRMGINNKGIKHAVSYIQKHRNACPIGCSITKGRETLMQDAYKDYEFSFEYMYDFVDYFVLNVSCPNVDGGAALGEDPKAAEAVTRAVKGVAKKPVIVKLSPNVRDITEIAKACESGGADGLSLINAPHGMKIDLKKYQIISFDEDSVILNKVFNYKIVEMKNNIKVGFPLNNIDMVIDKLKELNINYMIVEDKSIVSKYESDDNSFSKYTGSVFEIISINNRINKIVEKLKSIGNDKVGYILSEIESMIDV